MNNKDIKQLAQSLISTHETYNLNELCKYLKINIRQDYIKPAKGYSTRAKRINIITLDYDLDEKEKEVVLLHEIGHTLLHNDCNTTFFLSFTRFSINRQEKEANLFAMYFLMEKYKTELEDATTLQDVSNITGINMDFLIQYYKY